MADDLIPVLDVDVNAMKPGEVARLLITRACNDNDLDWAEIACDTLRYKDRIGLTATLVSIVEQLLGLIAQDNGMTSAELWQDQMLSEARDATDG